MHVLSKRGGIVDIQTSAVDSVMCTATRCENIHLACYMHMNSGCALASGIRVTGAAGVIHSGRPEETKHAILFRPLHYSRVASRECGPKRYIICRCATACVFVFFVTCWIYDYCAIVA